MARTKKRTSQQIQEEFLSQKHLEEMKQVTEAETRINREQVENAPPETPEPPKVPPTPTLDTNSYYPTIALRGPRFVTIRQQAERPLGFPAIKLPKGGSADRPTSAIVSTRVSTLYRGRRLFLGPAATGADPLKNANDPQMQTLLSMANVLVMDILVGKDSQLANTEPLPASMFCPISTGVDMNFETAKTGALISLTLGNTGKEAVTLHAGMVGKEIWFETGELVEPDWEAIRALTEEYKKEARSEALEKQKLVEGQLVAKIKRLESEKEAHNRAVRAANAETLRKAEEAKKAAQDRAAAKEAKKNKSSKPRPKPGK
jgi:hypothetical protein